MRTRAPSFLWACLFGAVSAASCTSGTAARPTQTSVDGGGGEVGNVVGQSGGAGLDGAPGGSGGAGGATAAVDFYYQTKTPYRPRQDATTYEAPPAGYSVVYTELVARHGTRGLSSMKDDLAVYNLWQKASTENALTTLGAQLGPDVLAIMKANFLLGYGVPGIKKPGYGNETQVGITEHQQLALRLRSRNAGLFTQVGAAATSAPRQLVVVTSGVDRAVDSGAFFVASLLGAQPNLTPLVTYPPAPAPYPAAAPVAQPAGTNRFLLYFHKLVPATDLVMDTADPLYSTYQSSKAYQDFQASPAAAAKQAAVLTDPAAAVVGRAVLERLFARSFVAELEAKAFSVANTGTITYSSDDGAFTSTLVGDGKTVLTSPAEAAVSIYNLYSVAPALDAEAGVDFKPYVTLDEAKFLAYTQDAGDFYGKGPGITESGDVNWRMAQILLDDFFSEVDAIARGELSHAAKLRFTHAEIMIPFASILGLKGTTAQVPMASTYGYDSNPWRGEDISPMAANIQWDVLRGASGGLLVKMLHNEGETDFKPACDGARVASDSHFYDFARLATCYGHVAAPAAP